MVEEAENKATFCLGLGIQPSEYDNMTQIEIAAFQKIQKKRDDEAKRGRG